MRLQRILAAAGVASRRGAEAFLRAGRVTVNGHPAALGASADPARDVVCVDGRRVVPEPLEYWLVNKPLGVVSTLRDPEGRPTIRDLVPDSRARLVPVGRLDRDTEGLVVLTNDGPLHHALLHPSHEIEREYGVRVRGRMDDETLRRLAEGVELDDGPTARARVERVRRGRDATSLHLTLVEGRKRQIRRALRALGHPVLSLRRVRMGPLRLGRLPGGVARRLTAHEREALLRHAGLSAGKGKRARSSGAKRAQSRGKGATSKRDRD